MQKHCLNCGKTIFPVDAYCSACAQKTTTHRLSLHDVFHDTIHFITHGDKGFFVLLKNLSLRTGIVAKEYVEGKRKKHFSPVTFFFIVAGIYVFIMTLSARPSLQQDVFKSHPELNRIPDETRRAKVAAIYVRADKARIFMSRHSNTVLMMAVPLLTIFFWLFYKKAGYNYMEHLVANMYMAGFTLLIQAVIFAPLIAVLKLKEFNFLLVSFLVFQAVYFAVFYYHFIGRHSTGAKIKAALVAVGIIVLWSLISGTLIRLYISHGFWGMMH